MPLKITCPGCQKSFQAADAARGKRVRCPGCQQAFTAEPAAPALDEDAPAAGRGKKKSLLPAVLIGCGVLVFLCGGLGSVGGFFGWRALRNAADEARERVEVRERELREEREKAEQEERRRQQEQIRARQEELRRQQEPVRPRPPDDRGEKPQPAEPTVPVRPDAPPVPEPEEFIAPGPPAPPEPPAADVVARAETGVELDVPPERIDFLAWGGRGGNRVAVASRTQLPTKLRLQEYDTSTGRKLSQVELSVDRVDHVHPPRALSPDGGQLLARTVDFPNRDDLFTAWSVPDGRPLVQKWAVDLTRLVRRPGQRPSREADHVGTAFLLNGRRVLTVHESGRVALWELPATAGQAPRQTASYAPPADVARFTRGRSPFPVALAPDGSRLAFFNGSDGFVLLDTAALTVQGVLKSPEDGRKETDDFNGTLGAAFSPDGTRLAALFWGEKPIIRRPATRRPVLVRWDVASKQRLDRFDDPSWQPPEMDVLPPGLAWCGPDHCWVRHRLGGDKLVSWDRRRVVLRVDLGREHGGLQFGPTDDRCWMLITPPGGRAVLKYVPLPGEALKSADQPLRLTYHGILRK